ncbi:MAG: hydroxyisourate hydrolase [Deltaproteobacteria bacterium]|nr:hydroxyisourate hydrolase [Deltaproteobacteria bacterium]
MGISTHILDTSLGKPANAVAIVLERQITAEGEFERVAGGTTDADGRLKLVEGEPAAGTYRLRFAIGEYFWRAGREAFFPIAEVAFVVKNTNEHYHVPLLLNPFGYSTYRGS